MVSKKRAQGRNDSPFDLESNPLEKLHYRHGFDDVFGQEWEPLPEAYAQKKVRVHIHFRPRWASKRVLREYCACFYRAEVQADVKDVGTRRENETRALSV